ncbi:hypothetical protein GCM10019060_12040 [Novosphingobium pokkalii]|nr:hypothetical protein GCM10019060_12040 [Novosphingobium pokkalii]
MVDTWRKASHHPLTPSSEEEGEMCVSPFGLSLSKPPARMYNARHFHTGSQVNRRNDFTPGSGRAARIGKK